MKKKKNLQQKNANENYKIEMIENENYLFLVNEKNVYNCPITNSRFEPREFTFILLEGEHKGKFVCEYFATQYGFTINNSLFKKLTNGEFAMRYIKESRIKIEKIKKSVKDIIESKNIEDILDNYESDYNEFDNLPF